MITPRYETNEPRTIPHKLNAQYSMRRKRNENNSSQFEMGTAHTAANWFDLRFAENTGLEFWQAINNAIVLCGSMPADSMVKVVKRNLDDTEAAISQILEVCRSGSKLWDPTQ